MSEPHQPRILLVDDEPLYLETTSQLLRQSGFDCVCAADASVAIGELRRHDFDLLLTDLSMPGNFRLELLRAGRRDWPELPVIVVTGVPSLPTAIEGVRLGVADYLIKPVKFEVLLQSIRRILGQSTGVDPPPESAAASDGVGAAGSSRDDRDIEASLGGSPKAEGVLGSSPGMVRVLELIGRIADSDANVLVSGESGTGKELVAREIHRLSLRRGKPFRVVDCTALTGENFDSLLFGRPHPGNSHSGNSHSGNEEGPVDEGRGLLWEAENGTVFLDEIGELSLELQPRLLRLIEEQTFVPHGSTTARRLNVRFICSTQRRLLREVAEGRFRQDLFYRLSVLHLELPPLRDRGEDIVELAQHFLGQFGRGRLQIRGFTEACTGQLRGHTWPGNVRELRNAIESAVALCRRDLVDVDDLPAWVSPMSAVAERFGPALSQPEAVLGLSRDAALGNTDKRYFETLLETCDGNVSRAARHAGLSRQALHKLLKKHEISAAKYRKG